MFKVKTEDGRIYEGTVGMIFNCSLFEEEWFPKPRTDLFEVGFLSRKAEIPKFEKEPKVGLCVAVDLQISGLPGGSVWLSSPIVEILEWQK
jgi:hypothetical protein